MAKELSVGAEEFYTSYKDDRLPKLRVTKKQYKKIIREFFYLMAKEIIENRYCWVLPFQIGTIVITKKKLLFDSKPIDWNQTRLAGKIIRYKNLHTNGYTFKWTWFKTRRRIFKNGRFYFFQPVCDRHKREVGSRGLASWIKSCAEDLDKKPYDALVITKK